MDEFARNELFLKIDIMALLTKGYDVPLDELLKIIAEAETMDQIGKLLNEIWDVNGKRVVVEKSVFKDRTGQIEINMVRESLGLKPYRQKSPESGNLRREPKKWLNQ